MEEFIRITLIVHVVSGGVALASGLGAIVSKKGQKKHILSGNIYFWSMFSVIITGLIVGIHRTNLFLQAIAIFSFYMAFTGKRVLRNKKAVNPTALDWGMNILALLVSVLMLTWGILILIQRGFVGAAPMLMVFGGLLLSMTLSDAKKMWKKKMVKNAWLLDHIGRMGGSFIATSTAFLLVNTHIEPVWIMWLLPTMVGTPLIIISSNRWKKKMNPKKDP